MPRKARIAERRLYESSISFLGDGTAVLVPARGAWITRVDAGTGERVSCFREPTRRLFANVGDELVVSRVDADDDNAYADVIAIEQDGWIERLRVRFRGAGVWPGAKAVWLQTSKLGARRAA